MGKIKTFSQFESFSGRLDEELTPALRNKAADIAYHKADASKDPITRKKRLNQAYALSAFPPHVNSLAKKAADMVAKDIIGEHYDASSVKYSLSKGDFRDQTNSARFSVSVPLASLSDPGRTAPTKAAKYVQLLVIEYRMGDVLVDGGVDKLRDSTIRVLSRLAEEVQKDLDLTS